MRSVLLILVAAELLAGPPLSMKPPVDWRSPCKEAADLLGGDPNITDEKLLMIIRNMVDTKPVPEVMGKRVLSFLYSASHLTGAEKVDVWLRAVDLMKGLDKEEGFFNREIKTDKEYVKVYGSQMAGYLLIIDLRDGQCYNSTMWPEQYPKKWDLEELSRMKRITKRGLPYNPAHRNQ